jgi:hypothetical protein
MRESNILEKVFKIEMSENSFKVVSVDLTAQNVIARPVKVETDLSFYEEHTVSNMSFINRPPRSFDLEIKHTRIPSIKKIKGII